VVAAATSWRISATVLVTLLKSGKRDDVNRRDIKMVYRSTEDLIHACKFGRIAYSITTSQVDCPSNGFIKPSIYFAYNKTCCTVLLQISNMGDHIKD
jgi:hypothetical protein